MIKISVGIDIAKLTFVAAILIKGCEHIKEFSHVGLGFSESTTWLTSFTTGDLHFCMESTGKYGNSLALHLYTAGHDVSLVNPGRIKYFMKRQLIRNKTDKADAKSIRLYGEMFSPSLWQPLPENIEVLRALNRRADTLKKILTQEKNRLENTEESVHQNIQAHIDYIQTALEEIESKISSHINNDENLKHNASLLKTILGIGDKTISTVLSHFHDIDKFEHPKQMAAFIGLNPSQSQSGTSLNSSRLSKVGNARLRAAFFMPALVAIRYNRTLKAFYEKLVEKGKPKKVALCAVMRKLVHIPTNCFGDFLFFC